MYCEFDSSNLTQKQLFFKLKNVFMLSSELIFNEKISGTYAIYKNKICLYVGKSKNLPSRLATHMMGAYKNADTFLIFSEVGCLDLEELFLIKNLKPTDNIIADYSIEIDNDLVSYNIQNFIKDKDNLTIPTFYIQKEEDIIKVGHYDFDLFLSSHPYIKFTIEEAMSVAEHFNDKFFGYNLISEA